MDLQGIPLIPLAAFIGASLLFLYQVRKFTRKKKVTKPSIPNFTTVATPQQLMPNVSFEAPKPQKKRRVGIYYGIIGMVFIAIGVMAFSYFGSERITYVPRADEPDPLFVQNPTETPQVPTSTPLISDPTATPELPTSTPLLTNTPAPAPTSLVPTATRIPTPTVIPTRVPTTPPTATPVAIAQAYITPTIPIKTSPSPTQKIVTPAVSTSAKSPTPQTIPNSGLSLWPLVMITAGGGLLLLGLLF